MPRFRYEALDSEGRPIAGDVQAASANEAVRALSGSGLRVRSIGDSIVQNPNPSTIASPASQAPQPGRNHQAQPSVKTPQTKRTRRAGDNQRWLLFSQLASLLQSGISPYQALLSVSGRSKGDLRQALLAMANYVKDGRSMSEAMKVYPDLFAPGDVGMVRVGELSGRLPAALVEAADQRRDARSLGMAFWLFWLIAVNALIAIPIGLSLAETLKRMFDALDKGTGTNFLALMRTEFFRHLTSGAGLLAVLVGIVLVLFVFVWHRTEFRAKRHCAVLTLPYLRQRAIAESMEVFSRSMEMLSRAGYPPRTVWMEAAESVPNLMLSQNLMEAGKRLSERSSISQALYRLPGIDEEVGPIVEGGELTGDVPGALRQVAAKYGDRKQTSGRLAKTAAWSWAIILGLLTAGGLFVYLSSSFYGYAIEKTMSRE